MNPWIYISYVFLILIIIFITILYISNIKRTKPKPTRKSETSFLANMNHEIRTPINSIVGFSELALDDDISPKTKGYLTNILENSEDLLQIINDILDISKIESGNMKIEHIPFDTRDLLNACHTIISPKANEKGLDLDFSVEPSRGRLPLGDPIRLRQIFVNLLSNAVKFTSSGSVRFQAKIIKLYETKTTIYVEVRDTGIGMTEYQMKELFAPFKQAESETTRKHGGTGLGLAITKSLLEMMGSELRVESVYGLGSKFSFEITFDTVDIPEKDTYRNSLIQNKLQKPLFTGEVLLCEDNAMNRQVICEHLARVGLKTVVAENGIAGVEIVNNRIKENKKQFDLIFMDMHMPEMDGSEASAIINDFNLNIPIIAMTANTLAGNRELYEKSGMSGYVGKPFTSQELWHCLLKFLTPVNWQGDLSFDDQADDDLRQRLIRRFVDGNKTKYDEITNAIKENDLITAHRLVHTLKSNAGQLNKTTLQHAAAEVERNLKNGNNLVTPQQLQELETELNFVLNELAPISSGPLGYYNNAKPLEKEEVLNILNELEPILKDNDPECLSYTDTLLLIPGCEDLIKQIENFDFELAVNSLTQIKNNIKEQ